VVSTLPTTFNGGARASFELTDPPTGRVRRSIDPDSYAGGFATWSGTSFATPVLAARACLDLVEAGSGVSLDTPGAAAAVDRGWHAVSSLAAGLVRP
jgi:serine protease